MADVFKRVFFISFVVVKDFLSFKMNKTNEIWYFLEKLITVLFASIFLIVTYTLLSPLILLYVCLDRILKFIHGELYGGLLNGLDMVFEMKTKKAVINVVVILSSKDNPSTLIEKLKERVYQLHQSCYKFSSNIQNILGYRYYLKNQVKFEDVVDIIKYNDSEYMSRNNLIDYLEENCLTIEENHTWKAVFFSQPIRWHQYEKDSKQIAMVLTFRHTLGDFPSIVGFLKKHFGIIENVQAKSTKFSTDEVNLNLENVCLLENPFTLSTEGDAMKIRDNLKWYVATFVEEKPDFIPKIKKIKRKLNVTFVDVFSAAISVSVCEYIAQRRVKLKNIRMGRVVRPDTKDILEIVNGTFNFGKLANKWGIVVHNIPFKTGRVSIKDRVLDIKDHFEFLPYSVDTFFLYSVALYLCTFLPAQLLNLISRIFVENATVGISNVVGLSKSTCCGSTIDDIFFFTPFFLNTGFLFYVYSYSGRIQVTAVSRRGFVHNREELQKILDNVFKNIDDLEKDIYTTQNL